MENVALLIFTFFVQAAIGIMIFVSIGKLLNKEAVFKLPVITAALLAVIGLLSSFLHLGRPLAAFHAAARFGSSWLSTEIWFTAVFTLLVVITAILIIFKPSAKSTINVLVPVSAVIGLIGVYVMASVYTSVSVPAWNSSATFIQFYAVMLSVGAVLFLVLGKNEAAILARTASVTACAAIGIQLVTMIIFYVKLGVNPSLAAQQSMSLLDSMSVNLICQWILILLGTGLLLFSLKGQKNGLSLDKSLGSAAIETAATVETTVKSHSRIFFLAIAVLIIGQIVGRYLFFAAMVVCRVGLS